MLYFSLCYAHVNYCNIVWASFPATTLSPLFKIQKRVVRTILSKRRTDESTPLFKQLKILKLDDINCLNIANFVYKSVNRLINSPIYFRPNVIGRYNLRREPSLQVPFAGSRQTQRFVHYRGVKVWNSIPLDIRNSPSLQSFKRNLKSYLIGQY